MKKGKFMQTPGRRSAKQKGKFIPLREDPGRKSVSKRSVFASEGFRSRRSLGEDTAAVRPGSFIVFEGVGGCGKGTQVKYAKRLLQKNKIGVVSTREPGGFASSEVIRQLIFDLRGKKLIGAEGQMVLFFAARKFWVDKIVRPNLKKGINILADRSYTTTGAYQGYAEGGNQKEILSISDVVMGETKPDAVILLDVSVETSMKRRSDPNGDPFDKENRNYFQKIIDGYKEMARKNWGGLKWFVVDGEPDAKVVSESVTKVLEKVLGRRLKRL